MAMSAPRANITYVTNMLQTFLTTNNHMFRNVCNVIIMHVYYTRLKIMV